MFRQRISTSNGRCSGMIAFFAVTLLIFSCSGYADAKDTLKVKINTLDSSKFPVVVSYVTVTDDEGNYYRNLKEENFAVWENRKYVESFVLDTSLKSMNIALVLDSSGSMKESLPELKRAAFRFIKELDPNDMCMIMSFDNQVSVLHDFTNDKYRLSNALFSLKAKGGTVLYDAMYQAINLTMPREGKNAIIVITDGKDESYSGGKPYSRHSLEEVIYHAKQYGIPVFTIGLGEKFDKYVLSSISTETDGIFYYAPTPYELYRLFGQILQSFKTHYRLIFSSPVPKLDEFARVVDVKAIFGDMSGIDEGVYLPLSRESDLHALKRPCELPPPPFKRPEFRSLRSRYARD